MHSLLDTVATMQFLEITPNPVKIIRSTWPPKQELCCESGSHAKIVLLKYCPRRGRSGIVSFANPPGLHGECDSSIRPNPTPPSLPNSDRLIVYFLVIGNHGRIEGQSLFLELRFLESNSHERDDCHAGIFREGHRHS